MYLEQEYKWTIFCYPICCFFIVVKKNLYKSPNTIPLQQITGFTSTTFPHNDVANFPRLCVAVTWKTLMVYRTHTHTHSWAQQLGWPRECVFVYCSRAHKHTQHVVMKDHVKWYATHWRAYTISHLKRLNILNLIKLYVQMRCISIYTPAPGSTTDPPGAFTQSIIKCMPPHTSWTCNLILQFCRPFTASCNAHGGEENPALQTGKSGHVCLGNTRPAALAAHMRSEHDSVG